MLLPKTLQGALLLPNDLVVLVWFLPLILFILVDLLFLILLGYFLRMQVLFSFFLSLILNLSAPWILPEKSNLVDKHFNFSIFLSTDREDIIPQSEPQHLFLYLVTISDISA